MVTPMIIIVMLINFVIVNDSFRNIAANSAIHKKFNANSGCVEESSRVFIAFISIIAPIPYKAIPIKRGIFVIIVIGLKENVSDADFQNI